MNTKLTLRMDESLIAAAKDYAAANGSSVSQMVANYFAALAQKTHGENNLSRNAPVAATGAQTMQHPQGPLTRRLSGLLKAKPGQQQVSEVDYHAYLERKYLGHECAGKSVGQP